MRFPSPLNAVAVITIAFVPEESFGCGMCVFALTWATFPPVVSWSVISLVWFLILALLSGKERTDLFLVPSASTALGFVLVGGILGFLLTGWVTMLPFLLPCLLNSGLALTTTLSSDWSQSCRLGVRWTGAVGMVALPFFLVYDTRAASRMDEADKIMKWDGTALGRQIFTQLNQSEPDSIDMYRKIMREAKGDYLWMTAQRLQEIGDPEVDVPILIEAYGSDRSEDEYGMDREFIEKALSKLTGLSLPERTPPDEWERR